MTRLGRFITGLRRWTDARRPLRVTIRAVTAFMDTDLVLYAGGIAYFALLSLFQLAVLAIMVLSLIVGEATARITVIVQIVEYTPLDLDTAVEITNAVLEARGGIGLLAVPLLIVGGLGLFFSLQRGVNRAFGATRPPALLREQLVNLALMGLVGTLMVASLLIGLVVGVIQSAIEALPVPGGWIVVELIGLVVPFILASTGLLLIYRFIPEAPITVRIALLPAVLAAAAWTILQAVFSFYATRVVDYEDVFGPIASGISLIVFIFFSSVIVLLGAALAHSRLVDHQRTSRPPPHVASPTPVRPPADCRDG